MRGGLGGSAGSGDYYNLPGNVIILDTANSANVVLIPVDDDKVEFLFKLLEALDDNDDVQSVSANFEVADETMSKLTA